jgi:hypothetical protein
MTRNVFCRRFTFLLTDIGQLPYILSMDGSMDGPLILTRRNMQQDQENVGQWNYETWRVADWLERDEASRCYWSEAARQCKAAAPSTVLVTQRGWTLELAAQVMLRLRLSSEVGDSLPIVKDSLLGDLVEAALEKVDWQEIAGYLLAAE